MVFPTPLCIWFQDGIPCSKIPQLIILIPSINGANIWGNISLILPGMWQQKDQMTPALLNHIIPSKCQKFWEISAAASNQGASLVNKCHIKSLISKGMCRKHAQVSGFRDMLADGLALPGARSSTGLMILGHLQTQWWAVLGHAYSKLITEVYKAISRGLSQ